MQSIEPKVTLLAHTPNAEALVYTALRQCYSSDDAAETFEHNKLLFLEGLPMTRQKELIQSVFSSGHTSVIEHVSFTFAISGVSRAFSHQFCRTRHSTISQKSQRYVNEKQFGYALPKKILNSPFATRYLDLMKEIDLFYKEMTDYEVDGKKAIPNEDARFILPNACETALVATLNCQSLAHVFGLRLCQRAQWEYREVAEQMYKLCREVVPTVFDMVGPRCDMLGYCPEKNSCGRRFKKETYMHFGCK